MKKSISHRIIEFLGKKLILAIEFFISKNIEDLPILNAEKFEWTKFFEENQEIILNEYLRLKETSILPDITDVSKEQEIVVGQNEWHFFPLYFYGNSITENLKKCPETNNLLKKVPRMTTAFFSVIGSGTYVKKHRGAYKGYLRYHLGVKIPLPESECGINIDNTTWHWKNGKSLIFDDTYMHDAWNYSKQERVVLYIDFIRPMNPILINISWGITRLISISPYVQNFLMRLKTQDF